MYLPSQLHRASAVLAEDGVIAYPTESVWSLGVDPDSVYAVSHLLALKHRKYSMGVILIASDIEQFAPYLKDLTKNDYQRLANSWPAPITWLVPANDCVPNWIRGKHSEVALRVSAHPIVRALCTCYGKAIVSTSANRHGGSPAKHAFQVHRYFGSALDCVVNGDTGGLAKPTEIRRLSDSSIVRHG